MAGGNLKNAFSILIHKVLDKTVLKDQGTANAGKFLSVDSTGNVDVVPPPTGAGVDYESQQTQKGELAAITYDDVNNTLKFENVNGGDIISLGSGVSSTKYDTHIGDPLTTTDMTNVDCQAVINKIKANAPTGGPFNFVGAIISDASPGEPRGHYELMIEDTDTQGQRYAFMATYNDADYLYEDPTNLTQVSFLANLTGTTVIAESYEGIDIEDPNIETIITKEDAVIIDPQDENEPGTQMYDAIVDYFNNELRPNLPKKKAKVRYIIGAHLKVQGTSLTTFQFKIPLQLTIINNQDANNNKVFVEVDKISSTKSWLKAVKSSFTIVNGAIDGDIIEQDIPQTTVVIRGSITDPDVYNAGLGDLIKDKSLLAFFSELVNVGCSSEDIIGNDILVHLATPLSVIGVSVEPVLLTVNTYWYEIDSSGQYDSYRTSVVEEYTRIDEYTPLRQRNIYYNSLGGGSFGVQSKRFTDGSAVYNGDYQIAAANTYQCVRITDITTGATGIKGYLSYKTNAGTRTGNGPYYTFTGSGSGSNITIKATDDQFYGSAPTTSSRISGWITTTGSTASEFPIYGDDYNTQYIHGTLDYKLYDSQTVLQSLGQLQFEVIPSNTTGYDNLTIVRTDIAPTLGIDLTPTVEPVVPTYEELIETLPTKAIYDEIMENGDESMKNELYIQEIGDVITINYKDANGELQTIRTDKTGVATPTELRNIL